MESKVVTLCGSTRFIDVISVCGWLIERDEQALTFGLHLLPGWYPNCPPHHLAEQEGVADQMDALHLEKISRSDEMFVVDFNDYIGSSTLAEIAHAKARDIPVRYFSSDPIGAKCRALGALSKQTSSSEVLYAFSVKDEERFERDPFDALDAAEIMPKPGLEVDMMRGTRVGFRASQFTPLFVGELLAGMDSNSDLEGGECADDWPGNVPDDHETELSRRINAAVDSWADAFNYQPTFFHVHDVKWIKVRILDADKQTFEVIE